MGIICPCASQDLDDRINKFPVKDLNTVIQPHQYNLLYELKTYEQLFKLKMVSPVHPVNLDSSNLPLKVSLPSFLTVTWHYKWPLEIINHCDRSY